ncbi:di-heme oxidoredictase family protein [Fulvivirgaceae bacterium BMA10]|uniref:Di-heme oxidoredictase family protein n=1 Tax=Splendidivirga corallicola TaxID=3051826 RepID=A0ABT8L129_9BACT|nr:di-heme oxidoredictase family protein [Fulvivirgaceae bacterium BMA10]
MMKRIKKYVGKPMVFSIALLYFGIAIFVGCENDDDGPSWLENGEEFSGGAASVFDESVNAFGNPAPNLQGDRDLIFITGNSFFNVNWVTAPASTEDLDGLGPLFNARSCSSCHFKDGRGTPPISPGDPIVSILFRLSVPGVDENGGSIPVPKYGTQLSNHAILNLPEEGTVDISYQEITGQYPDGESYSLRKPIYEFKDLQYGPMPSNILVSPRVAPHMVGLGLLEAIDEETILSFEDPDDLDQDGISGKANYVWDIQKQQKSLGRFGWKANQPNVKQQTAGAFVGDIGITSSIFPEETCTPEQEVCQSGSTGGSPELTEEILDKVSFYSATLAVPKRRNWKDSMVLRGKQLFFESNCTGCHKAKITTGTDASIPEFSDQVIRPYTDLLLHDMGEELADNRPDFEANGNEWRTPPLWGIGLIQTVNGHTNLLHDGRARNFEEAILWHGGEAERSKQAYMQLNKNDREAVIKFLESL